MPLRPLQQNKSPYYIFVLWGDHFEESALVIFTTTFREAGLHVKVVGLTGLRSTGKYGVGLYADLTLSQALAVAPQTLCVIVPCSAATLKRIENDPRVSDFFQRASANHAQFILPHGEVFEASSLKKLALSRNDLLFYAEYPNLLSYAQELAQALSVLTTRL